MYHVDEAHNCAPGFDERASIKHDLVKDYQKSHRHLVLVTATPHSGKEEAFRSLLTFLDKEFDDLPEDLTGEENLRHRKHLAQHFIQRRRGDIQNYLDSNTPFPKREDREDSYKLSPEYKRLFERVLDYARESVLDATGGQFHQRVRWWSALALLRSLALALQRRQPCAIVPRQQKLKIRNKPTKLVAERFSILLWMNLRMVLMSPPVLTLVEKRMKDNETAVVYWIWPGLLMNY